MAFDAGQGRVEITGDSTGGVRAAHEAGTALETLEKKGHAARKAFHLVGLAFRLIFLPAEIARRVVEVVRLFEETRAAGDRLRAEFEELGAAAAKAINEMVEAPGLTDFQHRMDKLRGSIGEQITGINEKALEKIKELGERSTGRKLWDAVFGSEDDVDAVLSRAQEQADRLRQIGSRVNERAVAERIETLKKERRAAEREMMSEGDRAKSEREDQEKELLAIEEKSLTEQQRAEVDAARKVFDKRVEFRKKEAQNLDLMELARRIQAGALGNDALSGRRAADIHAAQKETNAILRSKLTGPMIRP